jgi:uncharacterized protein (TIGR00369 family)
MRDNNNYNDDGHCFVCGEKNQRGMHLEFTWDEKARAAVSTVVFQKHLQGWNNVVHGGLISTVLDEVVVKAAGHEGYRCVTAQLTVKFKKPAFIEKSYRLEGRVKAVNRKIIDAEAALEAGDGTIIAQAEAKLFMVAPPE